MTFPAMNFLLEGEKSPLKRTRLAYCLFYVQPIGLHSHSGRKTFLFQFNFLFVPDLSFFPY